MNGLFLSPLGPALLLLLASILLRIVASPRRSSTLALLTLLPLALTLALLLVLRNAPGSQVFQTTWWPVVVAPLNVLWALDGWNWLSLVLLTLVAATAVLLTWRSPGKRAGARLYPAVDRCDGPGGTAGTICRRYVSNAAKRAAGWDVFFCYF